MSTMFSSPTDTVIHNGRTRTTSKPTTIDLVGGIYCNICESTFANKKTYESHYTSHIDNGHTIDYTCVVCRKIFTSYSKFRDHCYIQHVQKDKFKCQHCPKTFSKQAAVQEHVNIMHTFKCSQPKCLKSFSSKKDLNIHEFMHKSKKNKPPYKCRACEDVIDGIDACEYHVDLHCTFSFTCPICEEPIDNYNSTAHLTTHFGNKPAVNNDKLNSITTIDYDPLENSSINIVGGIYCCYCDDIFKNRSDFDAHFLEQHNGVGILYSCIVCKKQMDTYLQFGKHCHDHITKNKFECEECDKCFSRLSELVEHTEGFHSSPDAAGFKCPHCDKTFHSQRRLRSHMHDAHNISETKCLEPGCGATFITPKDLVIHQNTHKANGTWCRQCGLAFNSLSSCEKHLDVHKKKCFYCPICNRQYGEKYLLMNHISSHFEAVLHMCKECGKVFNAKHRLLEHLKSHAKIKNFKCPHCFKEFTKSNHLTQHVNIHTGEKPYKCVACPKTFGSHPNWHKHLRIMHNIDSKTIEKDKAFATNNSVKENIEKSGFNDVLNTDNFDFVESVSEFVVTMAPQMISNSMTPPIVIPNPMIEQSQIFDMQMKLVSETADTLATIDGLQDTADFNMLPESISDFVTEVQEAMEVRGMPLALAPTEILPHEYASDFNSIDNQQYLDLGNNLPHINTMLTSKLPTSDYESYQTYNNQNYANNFIINEQNMNETINNQTWDPPVFTKVFPNYYNETEDMTGMSVMNTDIY